MFSHCFTYRKRFHYTNDSYIGHWALPSFTFLHHSELQAFYLQAFYLMRFPHEPFTSCDSFTMPTNRSGLPQLSWNYLSCSSQSPAIQPKRLRWSCWFSSEAQPTQAQNPHSPRTRSPSHSPPLGLPQSTTWRRGTETSPRAAPGRASLHRDTLSGPNRPFCTHKHFLGATGPPRLPLVHSLTGFIQGQAPHSQPQTRAARVASGERREMAAGTRRRPPIPARAADSPRGNAALAAPCPAAVTAARVV